MSCCPSTAEGTRAAEPGSMGTMKKHGETNLYVTGPATAKAGLVAFPDIFGLDSGRAKANADRMGQKGYAVVFVDVGNGDYLTPDNLSDIPSYMSKHPFDNNIDKHVNDAINYLQSEAKVERLASYGYCHGGWVGAKQSAKDTPVIAGHVSFHPSWQLEKVTTGDDKAVEKLAESVKVPQLLCCAEDDIQTLMQGGEAFKIMKDRADIGANTNSTTFPGTNHGWVIRGDLSNPVVKEAAEKAWEEAEAFFDKVCPL